jgi:hypothetical protein
MSEQIYKVDEVDNKAESLEEILNERAQEGYFLERIQEGYRTSQGSKVFIITVLQQQIEFDPGILVPAQIQ